MWKPINKSNKCIEYKLTEIADALYNYQFSSEDIGLMDGKTGVALFFYYYHMYTKNAKFLNKANELIYADFDSINNGFRISSYSEGISGILFTLSILNAEKIITIDKNEILTPFNLFLKDCIIKEFKNNNYDYLHGALGYCINFLDGDTDIDIVDYIYEELERISDDYEEKGCAWKWTNTISKQTGYNLSLSHGIPSIIYFLSKIYLICSDKASAYDLLSKAIIYLNSNMQPFHKNGSYFSGWVKDNNEIEKSRLAWCYGDMGIAFSLWQAGVNTFTQKWKDLAVEIMLHSATRRDIVNEGVKDAGLCHGSSGVGFMFSKMYNYTNRLEFKEAANFWLNETMKFANSGNGLVNITTYRTIANGDEINDPFFLKGIAGTGLFLLSAISEIEPVWDRTLLLS